MKKIFLFLAVSIFATSLYAREVVSGYGQGDGEPSEIVIECSSSVENCEQDDSQESNENQDSNEQPSADDNSGAGTDYVDLSLQFQCTPLSYSARCQLPVNVTSFMEFHSHLSCLGIIQLKDTCQQANCSKTAPRRDLIGVASRLRGIQFTSDYECSGSIPDDLTNEPKWACQVLEKAKEYGLVEGENGFLQPARAMTRAEAYAVLMKSVCIDTNNVDISALEGTQYPTWQKKIIILAINHGFTDRDALTFRANRSIFLQEFYTVASRVTQWAQKHGGCPYEEPLWTCHE